MGNNQPTRLKALLFSLLTAWTISGTFVCSAEPLTNSTPEHLFGLEAEKGGSAFIKNAFDVETFYQRVAATLPASDAVKQQIRDNAKNAIIRKRLMLDVVLAGLHDYPIRFLGERQFEKEKELLFRIRDYQGECYYTGYITAQAPEGKVKLVDVHSFTEGELMSQNLRRQFLEEIIQKNLMSSQASAHDKAFADGREAWEFFVGRINYGKHELIPPAFEKMSPELQKDRGALSLYARSANSLKGLAIPVARWKEAYADDPCPDAVVVNFYWALYKGPRHYKDEKGGWIDLAESWTPQEESEAIGAIAKANVWLQDPGQEIRLARYFLRKQKPDRAKPLIETALKRFPIETEALDLSMGLALQDKNYDEVAKILQTKESVLKTDLTAKVNSAPELAAFRKSFAWKKWQHDAHGVDLKLLTN